MNFQKWELFSGSFGIWDLQKLHSTFGPKKQETVEWPLVLKVREHPFCQANIFSQALIFLYGLSSAGKGLFRGSHHLALD